MTTHKVSVSFIAVSFLLELFIMFILVSILPVYNMYVYHVCAWYLIRSPGTRVRDVYEVPCGSWGPNTGLLKE